eukprot:tig00000361_g24418.t1
MQARPSAYAGPRPAGSAPLGGYATRLAAVVLAVLVLLGLGADAAITGLSFSCPARLSRGGRVRCTLTITGTFGAGELSGVTASPSGQVEFQAVSLASTAPDASSLDYSAQSSASTSTAATFWVRGLSAATASSVNLLASTPSGANNVFRSLPLFDAQLACDRTRVVVGTSNGANCSVQASLGTLVSDDFYSVTADPADRGDFDAAYPYDFVLRWWFRYVFYGTNTQAAQAVRLTVTLTNQGSALLGQLPAASLSYLDARMTCDRARAPVGALVTCTLAPHNSAALLPSDFAVASSPVTDPAAGGTFVSVSAAGEAVAFSFAVNVVQTSAAVSTLAAWSAAVCPGGAGAACRVAGPQVTALDAVLACDSPRLALGATLRCFAAPFALGAAPAALAASDLGAPAESPVTGTGSFSALAAASGGLVNFTYSVPASSPRSSTSLSLPWAASYSTPAVSPPPLPACAAYPCASRPAGTALPIAFLAATFSCSALRVRRGADFNCSAAYTRGSPLPSDIDVSASPAAALTSLSAPSLLSSSLLLTGRAAPAASFATVTLSASWRPPVGSASLGTASVGLMDARLSCGAARLRRGAATSCSVDALQGIPGAVASDFDLSAPSAFPSPPAAAAVSGLSTTAGSSPSLSFTLTASASASSPALSLAVPWAAAAGGGALALPSPIALLEGNFTCGARRLRRGLPFNCSVAAAAGLAPLLPADLEPAPASPSSGSAVLHFFLFSPDAAAASASLAVSWAAAVGGGPVPGSPVAASVVDARANCSAARLRVGAQASCTVWRAAASAPLEAGDVDVPAPAPASAATVSAPSAAPDGSALVRAPHLTPAPVLANATGRQTVTLTAQGGGSGSVRLPVAWSAAVGGGPVLSSPGDSAEGANGSLSVSFALDPASSASDASLALDWAPAVGGGRLGALTVALFDAALSCDRARLARGQAAACRLQRTAGAQPLDPADFAISSSPAGVLRVSGLTASGPDLLFSVAAASDAPSPAASASLRVSFAADGSALPAANFTLFDAALSCPARARRGAALNCTLAAALGAPLPSDFVLPPALDPPAAGTAGAALASSGADLVLPIALSASAPSAALNVSVPLAPSVAPAGRTLFTAPPIALVDVANASVTCDRRRIAAGGSISCAIHVSGVFGPLSGADLLPYALPPSAGTASVPQGPSPGGPFAFTFTAPASAPPLADGAVAIAVRWAPALDAASAPIPGSAFNLTDFFAVNVRCDSARLRRGRSARCSVATAAGSPTPDDFAGVLLLEAAAGAATVPSPVPLLDGTLAGVWYQFEVTVPPTASLPRALVSVAYSPAASSAAASAAPFAIAVWDGRLDCPPRWARSAAAPALCNVTASLGSVRPGDVVNVSLATPEAGSLEAVPGDPLVWSFRPSPATPATSALLRLQLAPDGFRPEASLSVFDGAPGACLHARLRRGAATNCSLVATLGALLPSDVASVALSAPPAASAGPLSSSAAAIGGLEFALAADPLLGSVPTLSYTFSWSAAVGGGGPQRNSAPIALTDAALSCGDAEGSLLTGPRPFVSCTVAPLPGLSPLLASDLGVPALSPASGEVLSLAPGPARPGSAGEFLVDLRWDAALTSSTGPRASSVSLSVPWNASSVGWGPGAVPGSPRTLRAAVPQAAAHLFYKLTGNASDFTQLRQDQFLDALFWGLAANATVGSGLLRSDLSVVRFWQGSVNVVVGLRPPAAGPLASTQALAASLASVPCNALLAGASAFAVEQCFPVPAGQDPATIVVVPGGTGTGTGGGGGGGFRGGAEADPTPSPAAAAPPTRTPSPSPTPPASNSAGGGSDEPLTTPAKIGIGVGAGVFGLCLLGGGLFAVSKRQPRGGYEAAFSKDVGVWGASSAPASANNSALDATRSSAGGATGFVPGRPLGPHESGAVKVMVKYNNHVVPWNLWSFPVDVVVTRRKSGKVEASARNTMGAEELTLGGLRPGEKLVQVAYEGTPIGSELVTVRRMETANCLVVLNEAPVLVTIVGQDGRTPYPNPIVLLEVRDKVRLSSSHDPQQQRFQVPYFREPKKGDFNGNAFFLVPDFAMQAAKASGRGFRVTVFSGERPIKRFRNQQLKPFSKNIYIMVPRSAGSDSDGESARSAASSAFPAGLTADEVARLGGDEFLGLGRGGTGVQQQQPQQPFFALPGAALPAALDATHPSPFAPYASGPGGAPLPPGATPPRPLNRSAILGGGGSPQRRAGSPERRLRFDPALPPPSDRSHEGLALGGRVLRSPRGALGGETYKNRHAMSEARPPTPPRRASAADAGGGAINLSQISPIVPSGPHHAHHFASPSQQPLLGGAFPGYGSPAQPHPQPHHSALRASTGPRPNGGLPFADPGWIPGAGGGAAAGGLGGPPGVRRTLFQEGGAGAGRPGFGGQQNRSYEL